MSCICHLPLFLSLSEMCDEQGIGAVVGAITRNLGDLQERQGSYASIYDEPAIPLQVI